MNISRITEAKKSNKKNKKRKNKKANRNRFHGKYLSNSILGASGVCARERFCHAAMAVATALPVVA